MAARVFDGMGELKGAVGREVAVTDWYEITQDQINRFADATLDHQWIHVDEERARSQSPFGTTIAHGFLTLSLLPHFASKAVEVKGDFKMGINYGLNKLRFPAPVAAGSRVRGRFVLQALDEVPGGVQLVWNATVEIEGGKKPCLAAEWLVRYYH